MDISFRVRTDKRNVANYDADYMALLSEHLAGITLLVQRNAAFAFDF